MNRILPRRLRRNIKRLGFRYDPVLDHWVWIEQPEIWFDIDKYCDMILWSSPMRRYIEERRVYWNQSVEEFLALNRRTFLYYIASYIKYYTEKRRTKE